ncbi:Rieske 2Fe-2S domain-containing protein [Nocardia sp. NPDC050408]|uniref:Rieske 2Fe-2S domain-containing protein n=1 Tax=Nocardia sp. NPDC050408 TaxID=3364319 RepID=UPI0037BB6C81
MSVEHVNRRTIVIGAGAAAVVAACSTSETSSNQATSTATAVPSSSSSVAAAPSAEPTPPPTEVQAGPEPVPGTALTRTSDVPIGSGVLLGDTVVTQPSPGNYQAFSVICTHAGCAVGTISGGTINCPCHGSKFNLDGSVATGPATQPLAARTISVQGEWIVAGAFAPLPATHQQVPEQPAPAPRVEEGAPENAIARASDVPVGSGLILGDTVVTQPNPGNYRGFSVICTHQGCALNEIAGNTINCPCHGSKFNLDGSVATGPANEPLSPREVSVQGDWIVAGAPATPPVIKPWWCEIPIFAPGSAGC